MREIDEADRAAVAGLLGREPGGAFEVVVRSASGAPVVIANAPFLDDGTPMPTRYWLVGRQEREAVARLESAGGVREAEAALDPAEVAAAHAAYAAARDALVPATHTGPRPSGGVGGTRTGVKCLHAHFAAYLAGTGDPVGRWTAQRLAGRVEGPVAAIDCGTNSIRLLVLTRDGRPAERRMVITRLGSGVDRSGVLDPAAVERTLAVLAEYRKVADVHGVVALRAAATSAARDATNAATFFEPAAALLGVEVELLDGEEEGRLSYAGGTADLEPAAGPYLVVDVGGGSTELVAGGGSTGRAAGGSSIAGAAGGDDGLAAVVSLDMGCVRVTERFLHGDPPTPDELSSAREFVAAELEGALASHPALATPRTMVGLAGTVSAAAAMSLSLEHHDAAATHHLVLRRDDLVARCVELASKPLAARRSTPGLEAARADVIVGGLVVLTTVMDHLGHDELLVSESDILDGLAASLRGHVAS